MDYFEMPLISIIITTYKRTDRLKKAIDSALNQSYRNIEVIVVDDNANEQKIRKKVEKIMYEHSNVKYIQNKENLGGALSRNVGIKAASGEFISFLDDDDYYYVEKVEKQYDLFKNKNDKKVGLIYCYATRVNSEDQIIGKYSNDYEGIPLYEQMISCIAGTSLWFCPKEALVDVGMFEDTPSKQDSILLLKLLSNGYNVYRVPEELVKYTEHDEGRISGLKMSNLKGVLNYRDWCRKFYERIDKNEVKDIEYKFSKNLVSLYVYNNKKKDALTEIKNMVNVSYLNKDILLAAAKVVFRKAYIKYINK